MDLVGTETGARLQLHGMQSSIMQRACDDT